MQLYYRMGERNLVDGFFMADKKLYKANSGKLLGVCGGLAEYLNLDATVVRVLFILLTAFTGFIPGIVAYVIAALVMPSE
jgi:phage shock protein C